MNVGGPEKKMSLDWILLEQRCLTVMTDLENPCISLGRC